jgi:hypothetical protein
VKSDPVPAGAWAVGSEAAAAALRRAVSIPAETNFLFPGVLAQELVATQDPLIVRVCVLLMEDQGSDSVRRAAVGVEAGVTLLLSYSSENLASLS